MQAMISVKSRQTWLNSTAALQRVQELTGIFLTSRELLHLCASEKCRAHVDCSFAAGPAPADQLFVRKVKGAGYCELLESDAVKLDVPNEGCEPLLCADGMLIVRGTAWVYSSEGGRPGREDGIWRIHLGATRRPLYFSSVDLELLAAVLNGGDLGNDDARNPRGRKSGT